MSSYYYKCSRCGHECTEDDLEYVPESKTEFAYYICPNCASREIYEDDFREEQYYALTNIKNSLQALTDEIGNDLSKDIFNYHSYETTLEKLLREMEKYY